MKTTIVPAQITTVEDKIVRNLNLKQVMILLTPVFLGNAIYLMFPPSFAFALYKIILILCISIICCGVAIRFKERMILQWIGILLRYGNRPRYFICNKNDLYQRKIGKQVEKATVAETKAAVNKTLTKEVSEFSFADKIKLERLLDNPQANVRFKPARKGGMSVVLSEVK